MATAVLGAALLALLLQASAYPDCLSDDAFISFRYAGNWASGHGLVFNPGEERPVEGYTNFLWTAGLAAAMGLGVDPEPFARRLGLLLALLAQIATFGVARRLWPDRPARWPLPACLLAANSFFVVEAIQGLETALFACLLTTACLAWLPDPAETGPSPGRQVALGLLLGLAALTRPEGLALAAILLGWGAVAGRAHGSGRSLRPIAVPALIVATCVIGHLLFRLATYGDWLPNTFHAKTGGGLRQALRGLHYVATGWWRLLPWPVLACGALLMRARSRLGPVAALWAASTAGVILVGGDFKPTFRFLVWTLPLLALLATAGAARIMPRGRGSLLTERALLAAAVSVAICWSWFGTRPAREFARQRPIDLMYLRQASTWFDEHLPEDAVLATGPSGAIPYYTGRQTVDMWGLNQREIARRRMPSMGRGAPGHEKGDGRVVLAARPDVILFTAVRFTPAPFPESDLARLPDAALSVSERELLTLPGFRQEYRWRSVSIPAGTLNFFERRPAAREEE
ncbi:MAG: hypothetical protein ACE5IK_08080 [Acidobacteriota bacterium]